MTEVRESLAAGVQMQNPGCQICQSPQIVLNEETCISSTTRNYHGRFGGSTSGPSLSVQTR